jgi:hypothetical protein
MTAINPGWSAQELLLRIASGEAVSPEDAQRCLAAGVLGAESARMARARSIRARNAALRDAAATLAHDAPGPWECAQRLQAAIARFEAVKWPRLRAGLGCDDLSPSEQALRRAFLAGGGRVPRTDRMLYELLKT